jgi:hypothetical protein
LDEDDDALRMNNESRVFAPPTVVHVNGSTTNGSASETDDYGKNVKLIRHVLEVLPPVFTVDDVEEALNRERTPMKRDTVSQTLSKFARNDELIVAEKGSGRRPSKYRIPPSISP